MTYQPMVPTLSTLLFLRLTSSNKDSTAKLQQQAHEQRHTTLVAIEVDIEARLTAPTLAHRRIFHQLPLP